MLKLISKTHYASAVILLATSPLFAMNDEQSGAGTSAHIHKAKPTEEVPGPTTTKAEPSELQLKQAIPTKKPTKKPKKKPTSPEEDGYETVDHASLNAMMRLEATFLVKTITKEALEGRPPPALYTH